MYHVLRGEFADFFDGARGALFELHAEYLFEIIILVGGSWYAGSCVYSGCRGRFPWAEYILLFFFATTFRLTCSQRFRHIPACANELCTPARRHREGRYGRLCPSCRASSLSRRMTWL